MQWNTGSEIVCNDIPRRNLLIDSLVFLFSNHFFYEYMDKEKGRQRKKHFIVSSFRNVDNMKSYI